MAAFLIRLVPLCTGLKKAPKADLVGLLADLATYQTTQHVMLYNRVNYDHI